MYHQNVKNETNNRRDRRHESALAKVGNLYNSVSVDDSSRNQFAVKHFRSLPLLVHRDADYKCRVRLHLLELGHFLARKNLQTLSD